MESLKELYKIGKGPSSSHTMGPERAARDFSRLYPRAARFKVTLYGSLAYTGRGHLTDKVILATLAPKPCGIVFDTEKQDLPHPNMMKFEGFDEHGLRLGKKKYYSIGGGNIRAEDEPETRPEDVYPFANFEEILRYAKEKNCTLDRIVYDFEGEEIKDFLLYVWHTMQSAIWRGIDTEGLLPGELKVVRKAKTLFETVPEHEEPEALEKRHLCAFAFATSEENASGGTIVTAPTCGASGVLPAALFYLSRKHGFSEEKVVAALAVAGLIGITVKQNASVSGAEAGCQAEIGTATAMAAGAVCRLFDASADEIEYAAEIALEHQLGLTCDPIGGYVQIPCIERNAIASQRALSAAALARILKGTRKISFDLIVKTMYETGKDLNARYRETSEGGLAAYYKVS